jgi:D-alanyl-D-alanine carboxypeptidase/D-alanyl-D-alanine-endopeptidase (penicillin-binding protein 4)
MWLREASTFPAEPLAAPVGKGLLMSHCRPRLLLILLLVLLPSAAPADELADHIGAVINGPDYKEAHWGLLLVDFKTGKVVYEHNAGRLFAPASTTKLFSCTAALCILGADYKFETPVYRRGTLVEGRLNGDLILVASGDLTLGGRTGKDGHMLFADNDHTYANTNLTTRLTDTDPLAGLKALAKQVKEAGIRRVKGEVLIDDRLFEQAQGSGSGPDTITPILVNDNVVDILITPAAKAGEPATVRTRPETHFLQMDAQVTTVEASKGVRTAVRRAGPGRFTVRGQVPVGAKPLVRIWPVEDPADFARGLFIEALRREGIDVEASPLRAPRASLPDRDSYGKLQRVARFTAPPLAEAIKVTLKVSHNLYASTLPLLIAAREGKRTLAEGIRLERKVLADLGVDVSTISFGGGAGGARADMVTPQATVALLRALAKRPEYEALKAGLPVLGVDGTLVNYGKSGKALGKVRAKTGTLGWRDLLNERSLLRSKALAGVMTTAKGRELAFAFFVNDVPLPRGTGSMREGRTLARLCEIVYQHCP